MRRLLFLLLLHATSAAATGSGGSCSNRRCGSTGVPYPFGFSSDCPIFLLCNTTASTPLLPNSTAPYPITSFNSTSSTFVITVAPSCNRSVSKARASLAGASYGVSSYTGLFLRGGCRKPVASSSSATCTIPDDLLSGLLQTAQCRAGAGAGNDTAWTCVSSAPPPAPNSAAAARGEGQFLEWKKVDDAGCEEALTSLVYSPTPEGVALVEFGVAALGWWLNGTCATANATMAGQCAQNATCHDVETPSGARGHRCACVDGMYGDGYAAGDGCHFGAEDPVGLLLSGTWRATSAGPGKSSTAVNHAGAS